MDGSVLAQNVDSFVIRVGSLIRPPRRHGIVDIHEPDDLREQRDLISFQAIRYPRAVNSLVMEVHGIQRDGRVAQNVAEDSPPDDRVIHDVLILVVGQCARFVQDFLPHADLADIVQVPTQLDLAHRFVVEIHRRSDARGILADSNLLSARVGVLHLEEVSVCLDAGEE